MKFFATAVTAAALQTLMAASATAALLSLTGPVDHLTYTLEEETTATPGTHEFALTISGENTATDAQGGTSAGRSGINGIAFNPPPNLSTGAVTAVTSSLGAATDYAFQTGGLNSGGCIMTGNFFCFDDTKIPPTPSGDLAGTLVIEFSLTAATEADFTNYAPAFKIDWSGTANNYDLVSALIPVNSTCPDCVINPTGPPGVPEPSTLSLLATACLGLGLMWFLNRRGSDGEPRGTGA